MNTPHWPASWMRRLYLKLPFVWAILGQQFLVVVIN